MRVLPTVVLTVCLLSSWMFPASPPAVAQSEDLVSHPGYVNLESVESWFQTEASVQVDLSGPLLRLISQSTDESDGDLGQMVHGLQAIQVRGYRMEGVDTDEITRRVDRLASELESQGWRRVIYVRDSNEVARVFLRPASDGDRIAGLTVLAVDPTDETVLINVVGPMRPDQLRNLGAHLDVDALRQVDAQQ